MISGKHSNRSRDNGTRYTGPGNFFFDQMGALGTRQEFVDFLTLYDGRLLNVTLYMFMLEEYARPRPMTAKERTRLLRSTFDVSTW